MRPLHITLAALFVLGLAACDEPAGDGQTGQLPEQEEQQPMQQQPAPQSGTGNQQ